MVSRRGTRWQRPVALTTDVAPDSALDLPHFLACLVFSLCAPQDLARFACVSRSWRVAVTDRTLWLSLDLRGSSGGDAALLGATSRAGRALRELQLASDASSPALLPSRQALRAVCARAGVSLQRLSVDWLGRAGRGGVVQPERPRLTFLAALLYVAPTVRLAASARATPVEARKLLRGADAFKRLHLRALEVDPESNGIPGVVLRALGADVAAHPGGLRSLSLSFPQLEPHGFSGLVDGLSAAGVQELQLLNGLLTPAAVPQLARALAGLTTLTLVECGGPTAWLSDGAAAVLACGLREARALRHLTLESCELWRDPAAGTAVLSSLRDHPSLDTLSVALNSPPHAAPETVGRALAALLGNTALRRLCCRSCGLSDVGVSHIADALTLPRCRLEDLDCSSNRVGDRFCRTRLLESVKLRPSLRRLRICDGAADVSSSSGRAACERFVASRAQGASRLEEGLARLCLGR